MTLSRRTLITGLISLVAAPAIVRAGSLMPVKAVDWTEGFFGVSELPNLVFYESTAEQWVDTRILGRGFFGPVQIYKGGNILRKWIEAGSVEIIEHENPL